MTVLKIARECKRRQQFAQSVSAEPGICAALNNDFTRGQVLEGRKQIIGMATIDRDMLDNIQFALPPLDEQVSTMSRVRDEVSALGSVRAHFEMQLAEVSSLESALLRAAFSGAL